MLKLERNSEKVYITQTERKYFPLALEWCKQNNARACRINRISFFFDFDSAKCGICSAASEGRIFWYNMEDR